MGLAYDIGPIVSGGDPGMDQRIEISTDECMSSGKCVADFPAGFAFDDDELAVLVAGGVALSDQDRVRATRNCPSRAIVLFDARGERIDT